jgi:DNA primase
VISKGIIGKAKKVDIQDVIDYYSLDIKGNSILCPWHKESIPSAVIWREKNKIHCFGVCAKNYDGIDLVRKMEDCNFEKAVMFLYRAFSIGTNIETEKKSSDISLYKKLNIEFRVLLRKAFYNETLNKEVFKVFQTIDMNAENNLIILKLYKRILEMLK